jgi:hypothetical protein
MAKKLTNNQLAQRYGVPVRRINRWKKEGCPFDDLASAAVWITQRGKVKVPVLNGKHHAVDTTDVVKGAAAALNRLAEEEAIAFKTFKAVVADKQAGPLEVASAREQWQELLSPLRQFDLAVEAARRDAGDLVERGVLEAYAAGLLCHFTGAIKGMLESICNRIAGLPDADAVWQVLSKEYEKALATAIKDSCELPYAGRTAPAWLTKCIQETVGRHL